MCRVFLPKPEKSLIWGKSSGTKESDFKEIPKVSELASALAFLEKIEAVSLNFIHDLFFCLMAHSLVGDNFWQLNAF